MKINYWVYFLKDYKGVIFYIGLTKNLEIRILEHKKCKGNNPKKNYRVRRSIEKLGDLRYIATCFDTLEEAKAYEKEKIEQFKYQIVNVQHGRNSNRKAKTRKSGMAKQCPTCNNWYRRINSHKCKND